MRGSAAEGTTEVRGACPMDCPDTCSWIVTVKDGKAVRLRGDETHPFTRGVLCAKLNDYIAYTQQPDRLLTPLLRTGEKGEGRFAPISWEEALDRIAARFKAIIAAHGAEAIWPYYGTGTMGMLQGLAGAGRRLWNVLGASQHALTICTIAGGVGTGYTIGDRRMGMDPETIRFAKLILLWGTNTLSSNHHLWRSILTARAAGAHLVVIDPIRTRTAEQADEHIAPIPGTDAALALGLLNIVVTMGAEDRDFIERHTLGWAEFRARILDWPPARAAAETGLPEPVIRALGERLARTRPTAIRLMMGMQRHGGGGMAVRTITCIPGVTGDWRYPGGGAVYDTRGFLKGDWAALHRDDLRPKSTRTLSMTRLGDGLLDRADPRVMALFIYGANPAASAPGQGKLRRGLARADLFTVVLDQFMTDSARYADIVLPATSQLEQADLHYAYGHLYVSWNEPAVAPPGLCKAPSEVFRLLARAMGLNEPCLYDSDEAMARQFLASGDKGLAGITLERLKRDGWARLNVPDPFVPFAEVFPTPSGRLEFVSARMAADGLDPVAGYTPPYEAAQRGTPLAERFPLALIAAAKHYQLNSIFANAPGLARKQGRTRLLIHPADAAPRGIATGATVRVWNDRGEFLAEAAVTDAVRPGLLASTKGTWPSLEPTGTTVNATVAERDSDMGGGAVFHDNRVECGVAYPQHPR
jgi:anaerobic selenocysteine-containing dehydrogenase